MGYIQNAIIGLYLYGLAIYNNLQFPNSKYNLIQLFQPKMKFTNILTFILLLHNTLNFSFIELTVTPSHIEAGASSQYIFQFDRTIGPSYQPTNWNTQPVFTGSVIIIEFPSEYSIDMLNCSSVSISYIPVYDYTCNISGNILSIQGAINNATYIDFVEVVVDDILNPFPAVYTGNFLGMIGIDVSVGVNNGVQLVAGLFQNCSVRFDPVYVGLTNSKMIVSLNPQYLLDSNSSIRVVIPNHWTYDLQVGRSTITEPLTCVGQSSEISASLACTLASPGNIVLTNVLNSALDTEFSFGLMSILSPPTAQPTDFIRITSYINGFEAQTCTVFASGLLPNIFTQLQIIPFVTMTVNTEVALSFRFTLTDIINQNDDIEITFPNQVQLMFNNFAGTGTYDFGASSVSGQTLRIVHRRNIARTFAKNSLYIVSFNKIKSPTSTKTTSPYIVSVVKNGYPKMTGQFTMTAVASVLTGTVSMAQTTVNSITNYQFTITTLDPLSQQGMITIIFPSTITPTLGSDCAILSGTALNTNPTCWYDSSQKKITLTNINSTNSSIPAQTFQITILGIKNAPSIAPSSSFTITTYYTNDENETVSQGTIAGVTASAGLIDVNTVLVVPSSYVVCGTFVSYTVQFVIGSTIPFYGRIELVIPVAIQVNFDNLSTSCRVAVDYGPFQDESCSGSLVQTSNHIIFDGIASNSSFPNGTTISLKIQGILTNPLHSSLVSGFQIKTFDNNGYLIQQILSGIGIQMTVPAPMTSMIVERTSQKNNQHGVTYTFKLRQAPPVSSNTHLTIGFPTDFNDLDGVTCQSLIGAPLTCIVTNLTVEATLLAAVNPGVEYGVKIRGITNPRSFAPLSGPFTIDTALSNSAISTGSFTPPLQTSIPSSFSLISGAFQPLSYGVPTALNIRLIPSSPIYGVRLIIKIPDSFSIPSALTCDNWAGFNINGSQLSIQGISLQNLTQFDISGMVAPLGPTTGSVQVTTYDQNWYKIDESLNQIIFIVACTQNCQQPQSQTTPPQQNMTIKIIGASVGGAIGIILLIILIVCLYRRKKNNQIQITRNSFSDGSIIVEENPKIDYGPAPPLFQKHYKETGDLVFAESSGAIAVSEQ